MKRLIILTVLVLLSSQAAIANTGKVVMNCKRLVDGREYRIQVIQTAKWQAIASDTGFYSAPASVSALRYENGKKSVRNYSKSTIYRRLNFMKDMYIELGKNNQVAYGTIAFDIQLNSTGAIAKVNGALLDLSSSQDERKLKLQCEPTAKFYLPN